MATRLCRFALFACACLMISLNTGCFSRESVVMDRTVLTINGHDVTTKEFAERLALRLKNYDSLHAKDETQLERAKEDTIQAFVLDRITRDYSNQQNIDVSDDELANKVKELQSRYPDDFAFRRVLADENLKFDDWMADVKFSLLQSKVFEKITSGIPAPKEAELKSLYDANKTQFQQRARVRLRQIVVDKEDDAKHILAELDKGADMAKLAKRYSVAAESVHGGDTGWIEKGTLDVFDQAFKMNVGARSRVLKSPYGFHIYEVLKKEPEGRLSFNDAKAKLRAQLIERRSQELFSKWLEEQVRKTSVKRNDALIKAIKVTTRGS
jgi:peptidyl-prolyl cis-trans isomerase C